MLHIDRIEDQIETSSSSPDDTHHVFRAMYGCDHRMIDVTKIVQSIQLDVFQVANKWFTDPVPNVVKELIILFRDGHFQIYPEGHLINTTNFMTETPSLIMNATYGWDRYIVDVTNIVVKQTQPFRVCNNLFTDPCGGRVKELIITLRSGKLVFRENEIVDPQQWQITTSSPTSINQTLIM
jgi:hypothetical protein